MRILIEDTQISEMAANIRAEMGIGNDEPGYEAETFEKAVKLWLEDCIDSLTTEAVHNALAGSSSFSGAWDTALRRAVKQSNPGDLRIDPTAKSISEELDRR